MVGNTVSGNTPSPSASGSAAAQYPAKQQAPEAGRRGPCKWCSRAISETDRPRRIGADNSASQPIAAAGLHRTSRSYSRVMRLWGRRRRPRTLLARERQRGGRCGGGGGSALGVGRWEVGGQGLELYGLASLDYFTGRT